MNRLVKTLTFRLALISFLVAMLALADRIRKSPELRAGLAWAVRSWITPPDADAGWEQNLSGHPAWRGEPLR